MICHLHGFTYFLYLSRTLNMIPKLLKKHNEYIWWVPRKMTTTFLLLPKIPFVVLSIKGSSSSSSSRSTIFFLRWIEREFFLILGWAKKDFVTGVPLYLGLNNARLDYKIK